MRWLIYEQQEAIFPEGTIAKKLCHKDFQINNGFLEQQCVVLPLHYGTILLWLCSIVPFYSSIEFDAHLSFSWSNCIGFPNNIIIFDVDNNSLVHVNNKKNDIVILGKGPIDRLIQH